MASVVLPSFTSTLAMLRICPKNLKNMKLSNAFPLLETPNFRMKYSPVCCTKLSLWESSPASYAPTEDDGDSILKKTNMFETLTSSDNAAETLEIGTENLTGLSQPAPGFQFLKWPMWLLGPSILLITGMVPTLWLPISSIFIGPNIASLLSLVGLDCIFNLGATLFLLMADSCAWFNSPTQSCKSKAPLSYQFWNMVAAVTGFIIPLMMMFGSHKGYLQPQLTFIPSAILLGPYLLLLSVQILTEMLTWHWQSPVWLVTPVIYEAYRLLQLMRGLKLGAELSAPAWMMHTIRGLVSLWVLILGMQLMRVAWFAGFTAWSQQQRSPTAAND